MGSTKGYEYDHLFWMDDRIIWRDDAAKYLFEIRTIFTVKGRDGGKERIGSEKDRVAIGWNDDMHTTMYTSIHERFEDYWLSTDEIVAFVFEALAFAKHMDDSKTIAGSPPRRRVIPIAVELEVCTVQQAGETIGAANDRAIRCEKIFPEWLLEDADDRRVFLRSTYLEAFRVEGVGCVVEECPICLRNTTIGDQITILKDYCNHAFHYTCIVRWLLINTSCPICRHPIPLVHDDDEPWDDRSIPDSIILRDR